MKRGRTPRKPAKKSGKPPGQPAGGRRTAAGAGEASPAPPPAVRRASYAAEPVHRRLRIYSIDPSLALRLDTKPVSTVTLSLPWEELDPGPVGEYLEVVDYDPPSRCLYEPVDLDDPRLLAQDGLPPSEGTPQFHQQMAYAVASLTIRNFERALGRKVLWAPGPPPPDAHPKDDSHYVQRLRIHPHAMRNANAYYSPAKKALLFGYYPASDDDPGGHLPGGMVFTCLSHDVVAHETTHALLDGMHRRFIHPSNPDVLAFHEAFADIVALFQHFSLPDILRHEITRTRGELRAQPNVLGQLAGEFGRTTGRRAALRDAIGRVDPQTGQWRPHVPDPAECRTVFEPHERGAILVAAVFDAFLSIYESRIADLLRLATGGSGQLAPGAISPDLANRLAEAATTSAAHVLTMCVRALDYCPPVDLTFGEYLRALVTADVDFVPDDERHYRTAFIEAFRRRGIYPPDVRTLAVESLRWRTPEDDEYQPSAELVAGLQELSDLLPIQGDSGPREQIFRVTRELRWRIHRWLRDHFATRPGAQRDADFLGLDPRRNFEVHALRVANRVRPSGDLLRQIVIEILQEVAAPAEPTDAGGRQMVVEGGCTIVADPQQRTISYCIRKRAASESRLGRQREFERRFADDSPHRTYFGLSSLQREPVAALHGGG